jgi:hypothetical protein
MFCIRGYHTILGLNSSLINVAMSVLYNQSESIFLFNKSTEFSKSFYT